MRLALRFGVGNLNWTADIWLRCVVWTVAIMLPVQPLVAGQCTCKHSSSHIDADSQCKHGCDDGHRSPRTANHNCKADRDSSSEPKFPIAEYAPCDCPPSCPCHLRHAPHVAVRVQSIKVVRNDLVALPLASRFESVLRPDTRREPTFFVATNVPSETAL